MNRGNKKYSNRATRSFYSQQRESRRGDYIIKFHNAIATRDRCVPRARNHIRFALLKTRERDSNEQKKSFTNRYVFVWKWLLH